MRRRNRRRTLLTVLAVACATVVFCTVMVLPYVTDRIATSMDTSPRLVVINRTAMRWGLPESYSQRIANLPDVVAVNRMVWFQGVYDSPKHQFSTVAVDASNLDIIWPENGFDPATVDLLRKRRDGALVGVATMRRFGWKIGQNVMLRSQIYPLSLKFVIVGSYAGGADPSVFMFRRDYLEEALHNTGRVDMMWVRCANSSVTSRIAGEIDSTFRNSGAETDTETEKTFIMTQLVKARSLGWIVQAVGLSAVFGIALAVLNGFAMTLRERRGEIAVFRTLGFGRPQILSSFIAEAFVTALLGALIGVSFSALTLDLLGSRTGTLLGPALGAGIPYPVMLAAVATALGIGIVSAIIPTIAALRAPVFQSLRQVN
ncbi:MAG TPA: FtsX-like permease family protein [Candidatus Binataceae bacterium]|nr:FtsX-like permease family protein [Candidatus Binataceae bacterium]